MLGDEFVVVGGRVAEYSRVVRSSFVSFGDVGGDVSGGVGGDVRPGGGGDGAATSAATSADATEDVPLTYFMATGWTDLVTAGTAYLESCGGFGLPLTLVQYSLEARRPLRIGDRVRTEVDVVGRSRAPGGSFVRFAHRTVSCDGGEVLADQQSVVLVQGFETAERDRHAVARTPVEKLGDARATTVHLAPDLAEAFAVASGDLNPIHLDPEAARAAGFADVVVHGMCLLAVCLACTTDHGGAGDPVALTCQFGTPAHPGEAVEVSTWRARTEQGDAVAFKAGTSRAAALKHGVLRRGMAR